MPSISYQGLAPSLSDLSLAQRIGVSLPTILLVLIDMKCQQFIVQAKDVRAAYWGCILAALMLLLLAFLPTAVVMAAQAAQILPTDLTGKEVIPYILTWIGGGANRLEGRVLVTALAVPALGLGSNVLRIQAKTILDLEVIPTTGMNRIGIVIINALLALAVAFKGGEIIQLILCFYAAYLSTVWIPFIAFLLAEFKIYYFSSTSVRTALTAGSVSALITLGITILMPKTISFLSPELIILLIGLGFGSFGLWSVHLIEKFTAYLPTQDKTQA
ncbi:hypothetical protein [Leptolyngbya sp. 7M]|uniref:hypothetical protein n=1 Tax=Leptolyngbya sp. 7M TaxID=2812896 RepID=UPI001B8C114E|nr:hypothetical protein [Leptolyngbya sp. 7M]QYO64579.1 hypothetical protein JVX88_33900 [Leptolyngbya sp. 7M]